MVGKPNPILIRRLIDDYGLDASRTLMIGDRLDTDIMFGNAGGVSTALVLSGVNQAEDVAGLPKGGENTPTYLMKKLGSLLPAAEALAAASSEVAAAAGSSETAARNSAL